jgi:hypothetical protein
MALSATIKREGAVSWLLESEMALFQTGYSRVVGKDKAEIGMYNSILSCDKKYIGLQLTLIIGKELLLSKK